MKTKTDDTISRKMAIDALHKTMLEFFKTDGDDEPEFITASERMLLSVNKAISNALKALPSAQPEPYEELDFVQEHKKIPVVLNIQQKGKSMPSAQPEKVNIFPLLTEEEKQQNKWYAEGFSDAFKELSAQPEIITCKDCKHGMYDVMCKFYWCHGVAHSANWFCADGKRRE